MACYFRYLWGKSEHMRQWILSLFVVISVLPVAAQRQLGTVKPGNTGMNAQKPFEHTAGTYVVINGINMYYEQYGNGKPLLLIHGNGGSGHDFDAQLQTLSRKFKVIVPDSRAQGNTGNQSDSLTYELMAEDYYLLLQHLQLDSVFVLGWSDGGIIGLILAKDYPGTVSKLAISGVNLQPDSTALMPEFIDYAHLQLRQAEDSLKAGKKSFETTKDLLHLVLYHPDMAPEDLKDIQIPVLVISGDHDLVKMEHTLAIFQALAQSQLAIFPGSSHAVLQESPQLFNNTIIRFFMREFADTNPMQFIEQPASNQVEEE